MIPIYQEEIKLGLDKLIKSSGRIIYNSLIKEAQSNLAFKHIDLNKISLDKSISSENIITDLYPLQDILVSTGMNLNDDVFDSIELWKAKSTPEDKPLNEEHDSTKVRGHIIKSVAVNFDSMEVIDDNTPIDNLPLNFHLLNHSVLYKFLKTDLEKHMAKMISEIQESLWYMSQECLFTDFDYALANSDGVQKIVSRNHDTAFLTKCLRAFGGSGEYQGQRIGRLPRNIIFCGKGLVKKPANPNSIIFSEIKPIKNNLVYSTIMATQNKEEKRIMTDQVDINKLVSDLATSKEAYNKVVSDLAKVNAEKQQLADQIKNADLQSYKDKITSLEKVVAEKEDSLKKVTEQLTESAKAQVELNKKVDNLNTELNTAKSSLNQYESQKKNVDRANKLVSEKKVKDTKAAENIVANLTVLDDQAFDKFVANLPNVVSETVNNDPISNAVPQNNVALNVANANENSIVKVEEEALGLLLANIKKEKK